MTGAPAGFISSTTSVVATHTTTATRPTIRTVLTLRRAAPKTSTVPTSATANSGSTRREAAAMARALQRGSRRHHLTVARTETPGSREGRPFGRECGERIASRTAMHPPTAHHHGARSAEVILGAVRTQ